MAVVAAETSEAAEEALARSEVAYEGLPAVFGAVEAATPGAPLLHEGRESNVFVHGKLRHGDVEAGFAAADVIVESTYRTHAQEHAYLQPEAGLAYVRPDGRLEVICGGQWMHEERDQIAHALGLDEDQVVVRYPAIGGAFGGSRPSGERPGKAALSLRRST